MTAHRYHSDILEVGLCDSCPRCEEHAERPWEGLDKQNLAGLRDRIERDLPARSQAEDIAMSNLALHDRMEVSKMAMESFECRCFDCDWGLFITSREHAWTRAAEHSRESIEYHHVVVALRQGQTFLVLGNVG